MLDRTLKSLTAVLLLASVFAAAPRATTPVTERAPSVSPSHPHRRHPARDEGCFELPAPAPEAPAPVPSCSAPAGTGP